jgi:integrase
MTTAKPKRRRTKGDGGLFRRADGQWVGSVEIPMTDGRRRQKRVYSRDRGRAQAKLRELRAAVDAGHIPTTGTTTVATWLNHWLTTIVKTELRPKTYVSYEGTIRLHINPHIGNRRLNKLTAEQIRGMHRTIQEKSHRTAQIAHTVLSLALRQALTEGMIVRNPLDAVAAPKYIAKEREAYLQPDAAHLITTAYATLGDSQGALWAAAFTTGLRRGELLGLEWSQVDLEKGVINLEWQLQRLRANHTSQPGAEER